MNNTILSWYAYAESGEVADRAKPGRTNAPTVRPPAAPEATLSDPARVVALFNDSQALDAELARREWKYLWGQYGLHGLIDLARQSPWPHDTRDEEVIDALVRQSLAAGFDPVFGRGKARADSARATARSAPAREDCSLELTEIKP